MKIGYAILAHDHPLNVARLAAHLLDAKGAVSIHFDSKRGPGPIDEFNRALGDRAGQIAWARRVSVGWGEWSMIEATVNAITALFETGQEFDYIHLMSGADYPIRPVADFEAFLERHKGTDFTESYGAHDKSWIRDGLTAERYIYRHYFNYRRHPVLFGLNWKLQRALGMRRNLPAGLTPHFGSQWCTLTAASWKAVVEAAKRPENIRAFRQSWIPDEMFIQTVLASTPVPNSNRHLTLYQFTDYGVPVVFCNGHADHLARQPFFFARKISPYASKLRDEIDRFVRTEVPLPRFSDEEIGRPTDDYDNFRLKNKLGTEGKRIPGYAKDPWYGDLEWNRRPYVAFIGASDEELDSLARELDQLPGIAGHGRLFAKNQIYFAKSRKRLAGYGKYDNELRDHKPSNFLSDIMHALPAELCIFALSWTEAIKFTDVIRFDGRSHVVLVRGSPLRAFLESEALSRQPEKSSGKDDSMQRLDEQRQAFQSFAWKHQDYYDKQIDRLETARTRYLEIDLYDPAWRRNLADFMADIPASRSNENKEALKEFSVQTSPPALSDLYGKTPNAFELSQLGPASVGQDRQAAQMLQRIGRPYLVLAGASRQELSIIAKALNTSGNFEIHGALFSGHRIEFRDETTSLRGFAQSDTARRDADPIAFLATVLGGSEKSVPGFIVAGMKYPRIFDLLVHDPNARILVVKGNTIRALADTGTGSSEVQSAPPRWIDPRELKNSYGAYARYQDTLSAAAESASAFMAVIDLNKPDWLPALFNLLQGINSEITAANGEKLKKNLAPAQAQLKRLANPASLFTNADFVEQRITTLEASPRRPLGSPAATKRHARPKQKLFAEQSGPDSTGAGSDA